MLLATSALALAQDAAAPAAAATPPPPAINSGDTAWMLTSSVLVLAMLVPGLAAWRNVPRLRLAVLPDSSDAGAGTPSSGARFLSE
jgi:hypothetical protein